MLRPTARLMLAGLSVCSQGQQWSTSSRQPPSLRELVQAELQVQDHLAMPGHIPMLHLAPHYVQRNRWVAAPERPVVAEG